MTDATIAAAIRQYGARANNFDAIRLAAALLVLVSHAFPLTQGNDLAEPMFWLTREQSTLGGLAVGVFFFVSGMLVTQSWLQSRGLGHFLWKRALRLFPALIVVVLLSFALLGPLMTSLSMSSYFGQLPSWRYLWNALLRTVDTLPGVFHGLPYPDAVNGSLWTLPYEVRCYLVVALLGVVGWLGRRSAIGLTVLLWLGAVLLAGAEAGQGWNAPPLVRQQTELLLYFMLGAVVWLLREHWVLGWRALGFGLVLFATGVVTPFFVPFVALAVALIVPSLAYAQAQWPRRLTATGDYSYGVYLYAFPIQQIVVVLGPPDQSWWLNILFAVPATLLLAALSWHFVERPALALKQPLVTTSSDKVDGASRVPHAR